MGLQTLGLPLEREIGSSFWGVRLLVAYGKLAAGENVDGEGSDEI